MRPFVIGRGLLSSEGLKLAGLPVDAAFRHPLAVIHGGDLPIRRRSSSGCSLSSSSEGLKMQARREGLPVDAAFRHPWR